MYGETQMCLSICLFFMLTGFFSRFAGKGFGKNGKNATKAGIEILP